MRVYFDAAGALIVEGDDATEWLALRTWAKTWRDGNVPLWVKTKAYDADGTTPKTFLAPSLLQLFAGPLVTDYWLNNFCADHCTLCGNAGWIDTRGTRTPAGKEVGRVNYCICPNGQALRDGGAKLPNVGAKRGGTVLRDDSA